MLNSNFCTHASVKNKVDPDQWIRLHRSFLLNYALKATRDQQLAHDLTQDTFLAGLESLNRFEGRCSEKTWLLSILKNKISDFYGRKKIYARLISEGQYWNYSITSADLHDLLEKKELNAVLVSSISQLPEVWHGVFKMKHLDDEKTPTICHKLKISCANYWLIMHKARKNLRERLQKSEVVPALYLHQQYINS